VPDNSSTTTVATPSPNGPNPPAGFGHVPRGTLPATGGDAGVPLAVGTMAVLLGGVILLLTRRKICE
jgi:LPXTG-motif cell wall-anchored protein